MAKKKTKTKLPSPAITHFPSPLLNQNSGISDEEKIHVIAHHFQEIMKILGLDLTQNSLAKTPERVAKMYVQEVFSGLSEANFPEVSFFENEWDYQDARHTAHLVFLKASFTSFCEHHFIPMSGSAYVAYLPKNKLLGISKIHRIVRYFASRPQLQERLTAQIADSLAILLETEDVAVSITACHYCVISRGIKDENSQTTTNILRGEFKANEELRREFFEGINRSAN